MNIRNRKPLEDKTPRNTPKPPRLYQPGSAKPLPPLKLPQDGTPKAQTVRRPSAIPKEFIQELLASPSPVKGKKPSGSMHATPAPIKHHRGLVNPSGNPAPKQPRQSFPSGPHKSPVRAPSPLPPSSPPSTTSLEYEYAPQPQPQEVLAEFEREDEEEVDYENAHLPQEPGGTHSQEGTADDDPFGMIAAEKKLKEQREERRRLEKGKGKEVAPKPRAPLGVLAYASPESQSPQPRAVPQQTYSPPSVEPLVQAEDDDDEDLYADPYILDSFDQAGPSRISQDRPEDEDEEGSATDKENAPPEPLLPMQELAFPTTSPLPDTPKSPRPHHVDPSLYPMDSAFSSPSTPCDREFAVDSAQSTPSPTKPMRVITPLKDFKAGAPSSAIKGTVKGKGKMSFPVWHSSSAKSASSIIGPIGAALNFDFVDGDDDESLNEGGDGPEKVEAVVRVGPPKARGKPIPATASAKPKRKAQTEPTGSEPPRKRTRTSVSQKETNEANDEPTEMTKMLEKLLPKRPVRKPKGIAQSKSKAAAATRKSSRTSISKGPAVVPDASPDSAEQEEQAEEGKTGSKRKSIGTGRPRGRPPKKPRITPNISTIDEGKGKGKVVEKAKKDAGSGSGSKMMKVEVFIATRPQDFVAGTSTVARAPKFSKSTKTKTNTKSRVKKALGRGRISASAKENKGKRRQVESYDSESSGTRTRRRQRIEYFNKLDNEYKLAEENVYVI